MITEKESFEILRVAEAKAKSSIARAKEFLTTVKELLVK